MSEKRTCIDAGREGCPCALGLAGKCIVCSKINGGDCNDCNWSGSCIYTLFEQNNRKLIRERKENHFEIYDIVPYVKGFQVMVIKANYGFCQRAQEPGSFVFARSENGEQWEDMPVSILKSEPEKGLIHLGINDKGVKSQNLIGSNKCVVVRGVYYNGLSGFNTLDNSKPAVLYAKGIAIAPLRNIIDNRNLQMVVKYIDPEGVGDDFIKEYFGDLSTDGLEFMDFAKGLEFNPGLSHGNVIALTSPYYVKIIRDMVEGNLVTPNFANMCCGEGICGACAYDDKNGKTIHRCKSQINR